jgi:hypothetical protein
MVSPAASGRGKAVIGCLLGVCKQSFPFTTIHEEIVLGFDSITSSAARYVGCMAVPRTGRFGVDESHSYSVTLRALMVRG